MAEAKAEKNILYIGNDLSYWKTISDRFRSQFPNNVYNFKSLYEENKRKAHLQFLDVLIFNPDWVYIDFSENVDAHIEVLTLIRREISTHNLPVVGLLDSKDHVKKYQNLGASFTMIKDGEFHDVVFHPYYASYPGEAEMGEFAQAKIQEEFQLITDIRIGYISEDKIHAEGNFLMEEGSIINLDINLPRKNVRSKQYQVSSVSERNLYYDYKYAYDLEIKFIDEPDFDAMLSGANLENATQEQINKKKLELEEKKEEIFNSYISQVEHCQKLHKKWLQSNIDDSSPKSTKILVIDKSFSLIKEDTKPINEYPYAMRLQSDVSERCKEIFKILPQIIAIQYMPKDLESRDDSKDITEDIEEVAQELKLRRDESLSTIKKICSVINEDNDYKPFVVIFNCSEYNSQMLQDMFSYQNLINYPDQINTEMITKLASVYEKKKENEKLKQVETKINRLKKADPQKYRRLSEKDFKEEILYIDKFHDLSTAESKNPACLLSITESDIVFSVKEQLDFKTYRTELPLPMSICLVPIDGSKEFEKEGPDYKYRALIHSVGENDKKELRSYVNSVFFSDKTKKREEELAQFQAKNQEVIDANNEKEELGREELESEENSSEGETLEKSS